MQKKKYILPTMLSLTIALSACGLGEQKVAEPIVKQEVRQDKVVVAEISKEEKFVSDLQGAVVLLSNAIGTAEEYVLNGYDDMLVPSAKIQFELAISSFEKLEATDQEAEEIKGGMLNVANTYKNSFLGMVDGVERLDEQSVVTNVQLFESATRDVKALTPRVEQYILLIEGE